MKSLNPAEQRFGLEKDFDQSKYLTKIKNVPIRQFESYPERESGKVMQQGGNQNDRDSVKPGARPDCQYDPTAKEKVLMARLDKKCLAFQRYEGRESGNSIYRRDRSCPVDPLYDSKKLRRGVIKTTKGTEKRYHVDLKKQTKRDMTKLY